MDRYGYGWGRSGGRPGRAHRLSYRLWKGEIAEGLVLDHLCRITGCINPAHLEAVTDKVNILRGIGPTARNAQKTHCLRGHPFDAKNTHINPRGDRVCRICARAIRAAQRAAIPARITTGRRRSYKAEVLRLVQSAAIIRHDTVWRVRCDLGWLGGSSHSAHAAWHRALVAVQNGSAPAGRDE